MSDKNEQVPLLAESDGGDLASPLFLSELQDEVREEATSIEAKDFIQNKIYFTIAGICNNFAYSCVMAAAKDIAGNASSALPMLCNVLPQFLVSTFLPQWIHCIPYNVRIFLIPITSMVGMIVVGSAAFVADATARLVMALAGIVVISVASGSGEMTQVALSSCYRRSAVAGWGAGTGLAGVLSALVIELCRSPVIGHLSINTTVFIICWVPLVIIPFYYFVRTAPTRIIPVASSGDGKGEVHTRLAVTGMGLRARMQAVRPYVLDILSLFCVYFSEYTINTACAAVMGATFTHAMDVHDAFRLNNLVYQIGVFFSRMSVAFFHLRMHWIPSAIQLVILGLQAMHICGVRFINNIYVYLAISLVVGCQGGAVYSNAQLSISKRAPESIREFVIATALLGNTLGTTTSSIVSIPLEKFFRKFVE